MTIFLQVCGQAQIKVEFCGFDSSKASSFRGGIPLLVGKHNSLYFLDPWFLLLRILCVKVGRTLTWRCADTRRPKTSNRKPTAYGNPQRVNDSSSSSARIEWVLVAERESPQRATRAAMPRAPQPFASMPPLVARFRADHKHATEPMDLTTREQDTAARRQLASCSP